jgi:protoporphyrinogen oxidase
MHTTTSPTSAIIGGGISGLVTALRLALDGNKVTLFEASDQLGGLGTFFTHDGRTFEKFYHCMLPSDGPLLELLELLNLKEEVYWAPTSFGYWHQGRVFALNTAKDLLSFKPLPFLDRLRVGFTGLRGRLVSDKGLDDVTAEHWLTQLSGRRAFATFWKPMLMAKFGDRYGDVPALWFWSRFNREKGDSKGEVKGYIKGGYRRIIEACAAKLQALGADIRMEEPVLRLDLDREGRPSVTTENGTARFDRLVITTPPAAFQKAMGPAMKAAMPPLAKIEYVGVINMLLFLKRPLSKHYWVATPDASVPFDGVVETSTLTQPSDRGDRHTVYLTKYMLRTDERFETPDADLRDEWITALRRVFPDLKMEEIETVNIFRAPFVEPLYTTGYRHQRPPEVLVPGRVFMASAAQVYPDVTSWNGAVGQVNRTLEAMKSQPVTPGALPMITTAPVKTQAAL